MRERWKKVCRALKLRLPAVSRSGKAIRNVVFFLLVVVLFWWAVGAPALTPEWRYRRAERENLIRDTEIITVLDTHWTGWECSELVVAEDEAMYVVCLTDDAFYSMDLQCYKKQGAVTVTGVPEEFSGDYFYDAFPLLLITELPAVRAEVEVVLPPELSWRWQSGDLEPFAGAVCRGEDRNEQGVFSFDFPAGLGSLKPGQGIPDQLLMTWDALYLFRQTLLGIEERDYGCSVAVKVRLWDAGDQLIYDDVLTYDINGAEVTDDEN